MFKFFPVCLPFSLFLLERKTGVTHVRGVGKLITGLKAVARSEKASCKAVDNSGLSLAATHSPPPVLKNKNS